MSLLDDASQDWLREQAETRRRRLEEFHAQCDTLEALDEAASTEAAALRMLASDDSIDPTFRASAIGSAMIDRALAKECPECGKPDTRWHVCPARD